MNRPQTQLELAHPRRDVLVVRPMSMQQQKAAPVKFVQQYPPTRAEAMRMIG